MIRIGILIFFGAIITSMILAGYAYYLYQPEFVMVNEGQTIQIGPVEYIISYLGQHNGDQDTRPKHEFFQIEIQARNTSNDNVTISGLQFYLIDKLGVKTQPIYGNFTDQDLLYHIIKPLESTAYTTQFDIPLDEYDQYKIGIQPRKEQASLQIGIVCVYNC